MHPKPSRFVLDANIYISYLINKKFSQLAAIILHNDLLVFIDEWLIEEIATVSERPKIFNKTQVTAEEVVSNLALFTTLVEHDYHFSGSPDPEDDYLFALAITTNSCLVTGEKALLNWKESPVTVLSLVHFKELFTQ